MREWHSKPPSSLALAGTVKTPTSHPRQGKTQMFRRDLSGEELQRVASNPRPHTGKGYQTKKKLICALLRRDPVGQPRGAAFWGALLRVLGEPPGPWPRTAPANEWKDWGTRPSMGPPGADPACTELGQGAAIEEAGRIATAGGEH